MLPDILTGAELGSIVRAAGAGNGICLLAREYRIIADALQDRETALDDARHAMRWLAKYQDDLNRLFRKACAATDPAAAMNLLTLHWSIVQTTKNQFALRDLGRQAIDLQAVTRAIDDALKETA